MAALNHSFLLIECFREANRANKGLSRIETEAVNLFHLKFSAGLFEARPRLRRETRQPDPFSASLISHRPTCQVTTHISKEEHC